MDGERIIYGNEKHQTLISFHFIGTMTRLEIYLSNSPISLSASPLGFLLSSSLSLVLSCSLSESSKNDFELSTALGDMARRTRLYALARHAEVSECLAAAAKAFY
jgi:hypothetical protein